MTCGDSGAERNISRLRKWISSESRSPEAMRMLNASNAFMEELPKSSQLKFYMMLVYVYHIYICILHVVCAVESVFCRHLASNPAETLHTWLLSSGRPITASSLHALTAGRTSAVGASMLTDIVVPYGLFR